jgi:hypothetical protein
MAVQFRRAGGFRAGPGIEIHHRDDPDGRAVQQGPCVVRAIPAVEEDQVARVRLDNRAVAVYRADVARVRGVREDELAAR